MAVDKASDLLANELRIIHLSTLAHRAGIRVAKLVDLYPLENPRQTALHDPHGAGEKQA
jgi:hypothetical protein